MKTRTRSILAIDLILSVLSTLGVLHMANGIYHQHWPWWAVGPICAGAVGLVTLIILGHVPDDGSGWDLELGDFVDGSN